jgi:DNA-binding NtrC family response regulator
MPHPCRYIPGHEGEYVLVADNDERVREFVKSSLTLFLNVDEDRILTADSAQKAIDIMNRFKTQDRVVGLLIVDENMPGMSGFDLVNEVYARNHNAEVILMHDPLSTLRKPRDYAGDRFIAARKRVVHRTLIKPIHSDTLTEATQEVYRPVG